MKTPFCFVRIIPTLTAWGRVSPIYPAGQGVNGLLCPRSLLGCAWLSSSYVLGCCASQWSFPYMYKIVENVDFVAGYLSMRFVQRCCPVYGITCKCDKNATTLEIKRK